jgi:hypothetical protein
MGLTGAQTINSNNSVDKRGGSLETRRKRERWKHIAEYDKYWCLGYDGNLPTFRENVLLFSSLWKYTALSMTLEFFAPDGWGKDISRFLGQHCTGPVGMRHFLCMWLTPANAKQVSILPLCPFGHSCERKERPAAFQFCAFSIVDQWPSLYID